MRSDNEENRETVEEGMTVSSRLFFLLLLGFMIVVIGMAVIFVASILHGGSSVNGSAVIFIGPFPIIIGAGPDVTLIVLFSIIVAVISFVAFIVMNKRMRRFGG